ncbi:unnamed protein product, partial [Ectocarpus sp. 12 AP-2014]
MLEKAVLLNTNSYTRGFKNNTRISENSSLIGQPRRTTVSHPCQYRTIPGSVHLKIRLCAAHSKVGEFRCHDRTRSALRTCREYTIPVPQQCCKPHLLLGYVGLLGQRGEPGPD